MIIEPHEITDLKRFLEIVHEHRLVDDDSVDKTPDPIFFANRPHLLMPLGFDEFHAAQPFKKNAEYRHVPGASMHFDYELFFRKGSSGAWTWFDGITHYRYDGDTPIEVEGKYFAHFKETDASSQYFPIDEWIPRLQRIADSPDPNPYSLILPQLWTPQGQDQQRLALADTVPALLQTIYNEEKSLVDVHWRELEELVAELLRAKGMKISLTKKVHDGGRDIIARGELIPGEPIVLAVEVKNKAVVGLENVQRALRANEDFAGLLLATSGRFSAGVIREKERNRNRFRLFLKDGVALSQWIDSYSIQKGWKKHPLADRDG